ncbi:MAG: hypothetical protein HYY67_01985 [Thaumarchaeota archaeon]|nr:hypothetical protein [Nitrososphaerota archaeon]
MKLVRISAVIEIRSNKDVLLPVAVATLDGRAYYKITSILRRIKVPFTSMAPGTEIPEGVKLAITTSKEKDLIVGIDVVLLEDIENDEDVAKQKILKQLQVDRDEPLVVGVDPGRRIGVVGYYGNSELYGEVLGSSEEAIQRILKLLKSGQRRSKIVRIGNGNPKLAAELAETLRIRAGNDVHIEIVDESGTSAAIKPNIRSVRDVRSARLIAFRHGMKY